MALGSRAKIRVVKAELGMNRDTFWNVAQDAFREVVTQCGKEMSTETACANMLWQVVDNASEWGIIFLTGRGGTGMFCVYVSNRLSEEETKLQFKTKLMNHICVK